MFCVRASYFFFCESCMVSGKRTALGMGLAFLVGVLAFFITFQAMRFFRASQGEPLEPAEKRKASGFQASYLKLSADEAERRFNLADERGKIVVVNLFATWCGPCREEMPELKQLAGDYGPRGVVFVAMSLDQDGERAGKTREEVLRQFIKDEAPPFPILLPSADSILRTMQQVPIPQTFLYDRQGRNARTIVGSIVGRDVKTSLEELLKEQ